MDVALSRKLNPMFPTRSRDGRSQQNTRLLLGRKYELAVVDRRVIAERMLRVTLSGFDLDGFRYQGGDQRCTLLIPWPETPGARPHSGDMPQRLPVRFVDTSRSVHIVQRRLRSTSTFCFMATVRSAAGRRAHHSGPRSVSSRTGVVTASRMRHGGSCSSPTRREPPQLSPLRRSLRPQCRQRSMFRAPWGRRE
jgi:hypothetical protein